MVSKEVRIYGKKVETLDEKEYGKLEGLLKENLPNHVPIEIQRKGTKIELWSRYPIVMRKALEKSREMLKKYGTDAMSKVIPSYEHIKVSKKKPKKEINKKIKAKKEKTNLKW